MTFNEVLSQTIAMLHQHGRVSYRALKRQFALDDAYLDDLKYELIEVQALATDREGTMLIWTGGPAATPAPVAPSAPSAFLSPPQDVQGAETAAPSPPPLTPDAERRQLTVLFCDLVDSTPLASQLDPEDLREVVRAYQETCAKVIARYDGHIAQYLGDGLLVYFGYPLAHEDDAQRAVRAGLGIMEALGQLNGRLTQERGVQVAVRVGIHTGLVVVGDVGGGTRQEQLALGETPNLAARLQGIATPNTLVISATTFHLLGGFFACQPLGTPLLKGQAQPLVVYRVLYESMARSRLEAAGSTGWTPLVGREQEIGLLRERWAQVKDGVGQVVLLSGEAGIGKSRLVQVLKEQVAAEPQAWLTPCQCSPYYQHSALYPWIDLLERVALRFEREESPQQKVRKLEGFLVQYGLPLAEVVPLLAALLSLPLAADYAPLNLAPEQQKQQTLHVLLTILLRIAAQQPVLFVIEDLHWVDPSTLELLSLLVDQGPTARILALFTFRPDFPPPWPGRAHLTHMTVNRLPRHQAIEVIRQVAHGKGLPSEVVEQIVAKTDGVPLFVEELTKMVLESGLLKEGEDRYALTGPLPPLAIPATLHDSLMARLDRLAAVKAMAQLGATLGREFAYELFQAVAPWDEETVRRGLYQLVGTEFLYQRGLPPQATYTFKHALIQDVAYQSLLRSTRQHYHQRIAQVLEAQFPETVEIQPELLAQHYTEASLMTQAIPYWQRAGQRAGQRSAHVEAVNHLTRGLTLLTALPDTPERGQRELAFQLALGPQLAVTKGYAAPEVEQAFARARSLCQQEADTPQLGFILWGLYRYYFMRAEHRTAQELAAQLLRLAQHDPAPALLLAAQAALGVALWVQGHLTAAREHLEPALPGMELPQRQALAFRYGVDPGVLRLLYTAIDLWFLGYAEAALQQLQAMLTLAQELAHPTSLVVAHGGAAWLQRCRRDIPETQARADTVLTLATEQAFAYWMAGGAIQRGWALAVQGHTAEGITHMQQGLSAYRATGAELFRPFWLAMLAEVYGQVGQAEEGLQTLDEALTHVDKTGERFWEAELHRLRGELMVIQGTRQGRAHTIAPGPAIMAEAEACFQRALDIARRQEAKSLELRAAMSLSRLWQQQGKRTEARELLAPIYGWFTEGFDTADLQEAKILLEELAG